MRLVSEENVNSLIRSFALVVAFGTTVAAASAQTAQSVPGSRGQAPAQTVTVSNAAPASPRDTMQEYRNADPLHGIFMQKPVWEQCGDQPVVGPMPDPKVGSLAAQPLYNFMMDVDMPGLACRKVL